MILHNPSLSLTFKVWDKYHSILTSPLSPISSVLSQTWFPPALSPMTFAVWRQANIYRIRDIISNGALIPKQHLEQLHNVTLPYFQICNTFQASDINKQLNQIMTPFETLL